MTNMHPHCGLCSQCLDRRFAILATGRATDDPEEAYRVVLLIGSRPPSPDRELALAFVRSASTLRQMSVSEFYNRYGEAHRATRYCGVAPKEAAQRIFELHQRHGRSVYNAFNDGFRAHSDALIGGDLPTDCLLRLVPSMGDAALSYPKPNEAPSPAPATQNKWIELAIDELNGQVVLTGLEPVRGAPAKLLIALAKPFRIAQREERKASNFPCIPAGDLEARLGCASNDDLRKRVLRCRHTLRERARKNGVDPSWIDTLIENIPRHGYRLNPDRVRIVALLEALPGKRSRS